jgi:thiamine-monophosphate kinase
MVFSEFGCSLVGGDTTKGPLTVSLTLIGAIKGPCLRRSGCEEGDLVLVSGTLGDARGGLDLLGLHQLNASQKYLLKRFQKPEARVRLGISLVGYANACIDISDGLIADLKHLSDTSEKAIIVDIEKLPLSDSLIEIMGRDLALEYAATGGDDYELAFTISPSNVDDVLRMAAQLEQRISVIGEVKKGSGVRFMEGQERTDLLVKSGYCHF